MQAPERKKIAVFYPAFLGGGAEAVGLWMLEALKHTYDLTLFTLCDVDFDRLNALYGTQLSAQVIQVRSFFSRRFGPLINGLIANNKPFRMVFFHLLIRHLKAQGSQYDGLISAYNAVDFGRKGLQYVHWIKVLEDSPLYNKISDFSIDRMKQNASLVNSHTVADFVKQEYGFTSTVLYPPVVIDVPDIDWNQKQNAFICSGRLTEAKEPHKVIAILKRVREQGFDVQLHLTGGGGGAYAWKYKNFVKKLVKENAAWVTLHENLSYADYVKVLSTCKYGIHFKQEPFGISIAEMVKAGAIPFVRNKGGQIEIVGDRNQDLLFSNEQEAVEKIIAVLSNSVRQEKLQYALAEQRNLFSTQRFISEMNQIVERYLAGLL